MTTNAFFREPGRPALRPDAAGILHLGLGNFHRAHQAVYTAQAVEAHGGPWGIVGAASRSHRVTDPMRAQGGQYSVLTLAPDGPSAEVMNIHTDLLVAAEEPERLTGLLASDAIRIVTLTVSENGYTYSHSRDGLDVDDPTVRSDLAGNSPGTVVGQLVRGLRARLASGGTPLAVVSCDNMNENGVLLGRMVTQFVQEESSAQSETDELLRWLAASVTFPSTMVDRIVPGTEDLHRRMSLELTGRADRVPVAAEPFTMWVLQDQFPGGRPQWEVGGAIFTDDVRSYELLKLRMLNASNSMLSYLGMLSDTPFIADVLTRERVRPVVEQMMRAEMLPTFAVPEAIDVDLYIDQLFARFGNRAVGDRSTRVASDGSAKLPVRITEPVLHHHDQGRAPAGLALLAAAYLRTYCYSDSYEVSVTGAPSDPRAVELAELGRAHRAPADLVQAVLVDSGIFPPELARAEGWLQAVTGMLVTLRTRGVDAAIADALQ